MNNTYSFRAGEDLRDSTHRLIRLDESGYAVKANSNVVIGTLISPSHEGGIVGVRSLNEIFTCVANSAISVGDYVRLASRSGGRVLGDDKVEDGKTYLGQAVTGATGKDDTLSVVPCRLT